MTGLAKVGDRIEHGQPIPGNVAELRDTAGSSWGWCGPNDAGELIFRCNGMLYMAITDIQERPHWWPMTVVEVDPEPQPAERETLTCWSTSAHTAHSWDNSRGAWYCTGKYPETVEPEPEPADLRSLILPVWQQAATSPDEPDNTELARWVGLLIEHGDRDRRALKEAYRAADPSQPVVLRLPEVPEGTVALIGVESSRRYELVDGWWRNEDIAWGGNLAAVLHDEREVTVEFAPPREPRTWPKLDTMPPDISSKIEVEGFGELVWDGRNGEWLHTESRDLYSWGELRALGEVREVIEP